MSIEPHLMPSLSQSQVNRTVNFPMLFPLHAEVDGPAMAKRFPILNVRKKCFLFYNEGHMREVDESYKERGDKM